MIVIMVTALIMRMTAVALTTVSVMIVLVASMIVMMAIGMGVVIVVRMVRCRDCRSSGCGF